MFYPSLLIWCFGEKLYDCWRHHFKARKCCHFRRSPTVLLQREREIFLPHASRSWGHGGSGYAHSIARLCVPISSLLSCSAGPKSVSTRPPVSLSVWPRHDEKYRSIRYLIVERQKVVISAHLLRLDLHRGWCNGSGKWMTDGPDIINITLGAVYCGGL